MIRASCRTSFADKLGVPMGYVESYINSGSAAAVLAEHLGVNMLESASTMRSVLDDTRPHELLTLVLPAIKGL